MTGKSSPNRPAEQPDLTRFLQDWTELWQRELRAQSHDPEGLAGTLDIWRTAMTTWSGALGMPPARPAASRDRAGASRTPAAAAAPDARDDEVRRLTRRVDELEARLAQLETLRRRRG